MRLTTSLLHARSGLVGAQAGLDVVSRNIANATTEGYTKKIHNQANLIIGGTGSGLKVQEVTRKVTDTLQESLREQNGVIEKFEILDDFLGLRSATSSWTFRKEALMQRQGFSKD